MLTSSPPRVEVIFFMETEEKPMTPRVAAVMKSISRANDKRIKAYEAEIAAGNTGAIPPVLLSLAVLTPPKPSK
jgi:hypothetical protein